MFSGLESGIYGFGVKLFCVYPVVLIMAIVVMVWTWGMTAQKCMFGEHMNLAGVILFIYSLFPAIVVLTFIAGACFYGCGSVAVKE